MKFAKVSAAKIKDISSGRIAQTYQKPLRQSNAKSFKTYSLKDFPKVPPLKQIQWFLAKAIGRNTPPTVLNGPQI